MPFFAGPEAAAPRPTVQKPDSSLKETITLVFLPALLLDEDDRSTPTIRASKSKFAGAAIAVGSDATEGGGVSLDSPSAVLEELCGDGFQLVQLATRQLSVAQAREYAGLRKHKGYTPSELVTALTSGPCVVAALDKENAGSRLDVLKGAPSRSRT